MRPSLPELTVPVPPSILPPTPTSGRTTPDSSPKADVVSHSLQLSTFPSSPPKSASLHAPMTPMSAAAGQPEKPPPNPFNFQPMIASKLPVAAKPNQRRGHKYKHSSVSHQIFLETPIRVPLSLPASLPIPTWRELYCSVSAEQRTRGIWCLCHFLVAVFTLYDSRDSLALTALSHLIVFDAAGASVCVAVDVLSNFEVWKRSSIRHPFGLERAEVLAGFAMSVFLLFMGFDIVSHAVEHSVEDIYGSGHDHGAERVGTNTVDFTALAALVSTVVSAILLGNHVRIGRAMRFAYLSSLPSLLSNPSHFLTLFYSTLLLLSPLLSLPFTRSLDRIIGISMALAMVAIGVRLVKVLGSMLLMSCGGDDSVSVPRIIDTIAKDPAVMEIQEARFWQAHHGLCIATLKLAIGAGGGGGGGCIDSDAASVEGKVRDRVVKLVRESLGSYGGNNGKMGGGTKWEVSVAITTV